MRLSPADAAFKHASQLKVAFVTMGVVSTLVAMLFVPSTAIPVLIVNAVACGTLFFAVQLAGQLLEAPDGDEAMKRVSEPIREGAEGFMSTQYSAIGRLSIVVGSVLFLIYLFRPETRPDASRNVGPDAGNSVQASNITVAIITLVSFIVGACFSAAAGYAGLWMSVRANLRVAAAASKGNYPSSFHYSLRAGVACGSLVVGMCIAGMTLLFTVFHAYFGPTSDVTTKIPHLLVGYGFGASFVALFAQLGGGIYTKAADVGADMVGKVEQNIPEDDPRNPAVIADLVGDNVGDCAGRGADLFESITGEIIGAMILGGALAHTSGVEAPANFMFFPLILHAFDLVISTVAVMMVQIKYTKPITGNTTLDDAESRGGMQTESQACGGAEDPLATLERGYMYALLQAMVVVTVLSRWLLSTERAPDAWWHYNLCGFIGIATSYLFVLFTKYYTDYNYAPVQRIANASRTGHGTNVIAGLAVGMESTALPTLTCGFALISSYWLGQTSGLTDLKGNPTGGLYGTAIATMGMLSTAVYVLAMDTFGPITDNAGGIVEMSEQSESARLITDRLDAVGNVTKATTKGYSIGAAALASFLLLRAFLDVVEEMTGTSMEVVNLAVPEVYVAGLCGGMLIFLFSGWAMAAVGKAAGEVVNEVRRQFQERPGIMNNTEKPDYNRCVAIVTKAALKEMVKPGLLAVFTPIVIGLFFRFIGYLTRQPLLGVQAVAGMLMFSTGTGILMALFLNNSGGAFDNAKKYIETGAHGGKRSFAHQAAVTGDTLGDPCKDTAGPSIHVLIKLLSTIALVLCPMFLNSA